MKTILTVILLLIHINLSFIFHHDIFKFNDEIKIIEQKIYMLKIDAKVEYVEELANAIFCSSYIFDINTDLLISISFIESEFVKYAFSPVGCKGYFQINDMVHEVEQDSIYDAYYNTMYGCKILVSNIEIFDSNLHNALNAYNGWVSDNNMYAVNVLEVKNYLENRWR